MGSLLIVSLMTILSQGQVPATDRPQLLIAPGAKVTLKQMQIGDRPYINVQADGVTFETVKLRLVTGGSSVDADAVKEGVRMEHRSEGTIDVVVVFSEMTFVGRERKKN